MDKNPFSRRYLLHIAVLAPLLVVALFALYRQFQHSKELRESRPVPAEQIEMNNLPQCIHIFGQDHRVVRVETKEGWMILVLTDQTVEMYRTGWRGRLRIWLQSPLFSVSRHGFILSESGPRARSVFEEARDRFTDNCNWAIKYDIMPRRDD